MAICLLGLGSNLGDRVGNLTQALAELRSHERLRLRRHSSLVETAPVGGPAGQANYFNAAAVVETELAPAEVLRELLEIERSLGRIRGECWGPRTIDLDLLLYDEVALSEPDLIVPHPRFAERRFVLDPAAEIAPDWRHPLAGQTIAALLVALPPQVGGEVGLRVVTEPDQMQRRILSLRRAGRRVGLVPTMGALHAGHLSLVRAAREQTDVTCATIFVNPTQFGPQEDYARYPRTTEADLQALSSAGCDLVFLPDREAMYPAGASTAVEPPAVAAPLEGVCRPGHFRGVATVVLKLFGIVPADIAFFGQKDYQQALVIRRMVADLNVPIEIAVGPTVREADGLAMSSRNRYLSPGQRQQAVALSQSLQLAEVLIEGGQRDAVAIVRQMRAVLSGAGIERIDYIALADPQTLAEKPLLDGPVVALIAAYVGSTRLIDNRLIGV